MVSFWHNENMGIFYECFVFKYPLLLFGEGVAGLQPEASSLL
jgi:hypothetical protein